MPQQPNKKDKRKNTRQNHNPLYRRRADKVRKKTPGTNARLLREPGVDGGFPHQVHARDQNKPAEVFFGAVIFAAEGGDAGRNFGRRAGPPRFRFPSAVPGILSCCSNPGATSDKSQAPFNAPRVAHPPATPGAWRLSARGGGASANRPGKGLGRRVARARNPPPRGQKRSPKDTQ